MSDAERDQAVAELSEHFQTGRLTQDEFDDRSTRALQARTGDNLRALFTDLPLTTTETTAAPSPSSGPAGDADPAKAVTSPAHRGQWPVPRIAVACVIAAIIIGNVTAAAVTSHGHVSSTGWVFPVIILLIVLRRMGRR